jgi:hypothetical protein
MFSLGVVLDEQGIPGDREGLWHSSSEVPKDLKRQEKQKMLQTKTAKKKLEIRRKEVLRSDPHEYANYLVSLNLLQQIGAGA